VVEVGYVEVAEEEGCVVERGKKFAEKTRGYAAENCAAETVEFAAAWWVT
jgi:hypothetical protein